MHATTASAHARFELDASHRLGDALITRHRLTDNGLTVLIWEDHRAPVFAFQTWFGVGSRHERVGRTGMAHLFEHLMFKATSNTPEGEFDRILEERGAQTNAATWVDWTYYREKVPAGNLDLVCRLEADRMEHMILDTNQLESEREVVVNERLLRVDNDPDGLLYERLYHLAYGQHPYGWPTIGWMEDIRAISLEDCLEFYGRFYAPNNATISVVGDVDTAEVLATVAKYYGHMPAQDLPEEGDWPSARQAAGRREEHEVSITAERGLYAWHAVSATDPDHAALEVLDEILTGGESSRVYKALVTDLELASAASGWVASWTHEGLYELAVHMRPDKPLAEAEAALMKILDELKAAPVGERELNKAKNGLESGFLREIADSGSRARGLGDAETTTGDFRWFFEQPERLRAVTAEDVLRVARRVFDDTQLSVIVGRCDASGGEGDPDAGDPDEDQGDVIGEVAA